MHIAAIGQSILLKLIFFEADDDVWPPEVLFQHEHVVNLMSVTERGSAPVS